MAQIDPYLERMAQTRASLAEFFQDEPWRLRYPGGTEDGSVASESQIQAFLKEMLPSHLTELLERGGPVTFPYSSGAGSFQCTARYLGNQIQLQIEPVQYGITAGEETTGEAPVLQNNSGQPTYSELPPQLRGFNLGAFLLSWIWAIGNNAMIGLLGLLPCIGFFVRFYLGFKGNELAWKNKRWESVDSFRRTQGGWMIAGLVIWGLSLPGFLFLAAVFFPVFARARENGRRWRSGSQRCCRIFPGLDRLIVPVQPRDLRVIR